MITNINTASKNLKKEEKKKDKKQPMSLLVNNSTPLSLGTTIRQSPIVSTTTSPMNYNRNIQTNLSFSNTNSNNGDAVYLGKTAALAPPQIIYRGVNPLTAVKETPAHVGWKNTKKTLTSLDKNTGKVEKHVINQKEPIIAKIQEINQLEAVGTKKLNVATGQLSPLSINIREKRLVK